MISHINAPYGFYGLLLLLPFTENEKNAEMKKIEP
jgi:hypothetical protein